MSLKSTMFGTSPSQPLSWGVVDGVSSKLWCLGCLVDFLKKVSPSIVWLEAYIKWYSPWYQQHNTTRLIRIVGSTNFATSRYTLFKVLTFLFLLSPEILLLPQHSSFFGILPSGWIVFSRWRTRASTCNHTHLKYCHFRCLFYIIHFTDNSLLGDGVSNVNACNDWYLFHVI